MMESPASKEKIAIDIKTTYIPSDRASIKFTLGSYGSYLCNNTKNIEYRYTDYARHYVIGFVYKRNGKAQESRMVSYEDRDKIEFPFRDVRYFIQEKYRIAGDKPGSGNTENIGSFKTARFDDLKDGKGPFSTLGPDVFDLYWKYYPKYRSPEKPYTSLEEFAVWFPKQRPQDVPLLHDYDYEGILKRVIAYGDNLR